MRTKFFYSFSTIIFSAILFTAGAAQAVLIDFDDIAVIHPDPEYMCFCDHPLTDEYLDKGLLIDGGFLIGETHENGTNDNRLLGTNFLSLQFIGNLPVVISMNISAAIEQAVFLNFYGVDGFHHEIITSGYAGPDNDTPYIDNQLVTFASPVGISLITLEAFYGMRTGAIVDNLNYEYTSIPESSSLVLLLAGLFGIGFKAWRAAAPMPR
jgi:hypothetical protein